MTKYESDIAEGDIRISWREFFAIVCFVAKKISKSLSQSSYRKIFIYSASNIETMILTIAAQLSGKIPILGSKSYHHIEYPFSILSFESLNCSLVELKQQCQLHQQPDPNQLLQKIFSQPGTNLCFFTSGSTGKGVLIEKSWQHLLTETATLSDLFSPPQKIVSFVPCVHIYGCLFSFLFPMLKQASVKFIAPENVLYIYNDQNDINHINMLIGVPAMWSSIKFWIEHRKIDTVVSSGGRLGQLRLAEFLELKQTKNLSTDLIEIFGSTETGGIGFNKVRDLSERFHFFESVKTEIQNDNIIISSPFVSTKDGSMQLADDLDVFPEQNQFVFKGRKDHVFKWAGVRLSLKEIEQQLKKLLPEHSVYCYYNELASTAKGGEIIAFIVGQPLAKEQLRNSYLKNCDLPFPTKFYQLKEQSHISQLGKITYSELYKHSKELL